MSVIKIQHSANLLRHRVTLLELKWKEAEDGSFARERKEHGEVWAQVASVKSEEIMNPHEWGKIKGFKASKKYKIVMRKYFSSNARHAIINALSLNGRVIELLHQLELDESGQWLTGYAADYERQGGIYG